MSQQSADLMRGERALSALCGLSFAILAIRRADPLWRVLTGAACAALLARACAGLAGDQGLPDEPARTAAPT